MKQIIYYTSARNGSRRRLRYIRHGERLCWRPDTPHGCLSSPAAKPQPWDSRSGDGSQVPRLAPSLRLYRPPPAAIRHGPVLRRRKPVPARSLWPTGTVGKSLYVAAAGLSITPPANVPKHNTTGWRLCATVFTAGLSSFAVDRIGKDRAGIKMVHDGTCSAILPDACICRLQLTSVIGRWDQGESCQDLYVPFECAAYFAEDRGASFGE